MIHFFKKGTSLTTSDLDNIDFFNQEQRRSARVAMKELLKNEDVNVQVKGRLVLIGGAHYSAVVNRLGYSVVLSKDDLADMKELSMNTDYKVKTI